MGGLSTPTNRISASKEIPQWGKSNEMMPGSKLDSVQANPINDKSIKENISFESKKNIQIENYVQISSIKEEQNELMLFDRQNDVSPHVINDRIRSLVIKTLKAEKQNRRLYEDDSTAKVHTEYKTQVLHNLLKQGTYSVVKKYMTNEFPIRALDPMKKAQYLANISDLLFTSSRDKLLKGWKNIAKDKFYPKKIKDETFRKPYTQFIGILERQLQLFKCKYGTEHAEKFNRQNKMFSNIFASWDKFCRTCIELILMKHANHQKLTIVEYLEINRLMHPSSSHSKLQNFLKYLGKEGMQFNEYINLTNEQQQVELYEKFLMHELETQNDELTAKSESKQQEKKAKGKDPNKQNRVLKRDRVGLQLNAEMNIEDQDEIKSESGEGSNNRKRIKRLPIEEVKRMSLELQTSSDQEESMYFDSTQDSKPRSCKKRDEKQNDKEKGAGPENILEANCSYQSIGYKQIDQLLTDHVIRMFWKASVRYHNVNKIKMIEPSKDLLVNHFRRRITTEIKLIYNLPLPLCWETIYPSYISDLSVK